MSENLKVPLNIVDGEHWSIDSAWSVSRMVPKLEKTKMAVCHQLSRREFLGGTLALGAVGLGSAHISPSVRRALSDSATAAARDRHDIVPAQDDRMPATPNFIIILCDNLGYGDIGCFGSQLQRTANIDRMANEGMRFVDFYSTGGVCTPSRASLMTGCYPRRINMHVSEDGRPVLSPVATRGLNPEEITIAELLKAEGYTTACIGKWHLGDHGQPGKNQRPAGIVGNPRPQLFER